MLSGQPPGPSPAIDQGHRHVSAEASVAIQHHLLADLDPGAAEFEEAGFDLEQVIEPGGFEEIAGHAADHEEQVLEAATGGCRGACRQSDRARSQNTT